jgi:hypothetical protein
MINTTAIASICLLKDFIRPLSALANLASYVAALSPAAIKTLEGSREGWQNARNQDFSHLLLATKLVAVGVLLEGPELVFDIVHAVKKRWGAPKRWWEKPADDHAPDWITFIGLFGWLMVLIGVAGEFWIDRSVNTDDDNIQSINITLLRDAGASAAQARSDANSAHNLAQSASDIALPAKAAADKAVLSATSALAKAGDAKAEVVIVESNIAKVDAKYAPRTLPAYKRDILVRFLRNAPIKPDGIISVDTTVDAPDGAAYGKEIIEAINDPSTGWKAKSGDTWTSNGGATGVVLLLPTAVSEQPRWAGELQQALRAADIGGDGVSNGEIKSGTAVIVVRRKN